MVYAKTMPHTFSSLGRKGNKLKLEQLTNSGAQAVFSAHASNHGWPGYELCTLMPKGNVRKVTCMHQ